MSKITEQRIAEVVKFYTDEIPADAYWAAVVLTNKDCSIRAVYGGRERPEAGTLREQLLKAAASGLYPFAIATDHPDDAGCYFIHVIPHTGLTRDAEDRWVNLAGGTLDDWFATFTKAPVLVN